MPRFTLGRFEVAPDGTLHPARPEPAAIGFAWRGRPCFAELEERRLRLAATAGRIPSTAEPGADRRRAFAMLRAMPAGWQVRLAPDHSVLVESATELPDPPTAVSLISAMVRFALALDPYLEGLGACGSGSAKT